MRKLYKMTEKQSKTMLDVVALPLDQRWHLWLNLKLERRSRHGSRRSTLGFTWCYWNWTFNLVLFHQMYDEVMAFLNFSNHRQDHRCSWSRWRHALSKTSRLQPELSVTSNNTPNATICMLALVYVFSRIQWLWHQYNFRLDEKR